MRITTLQYRSKFGPLLQKNFCLKMKIIPFLLLLVVLFSCGKDSDPDLCLGFFLTEVSKMDAICSSQGTFEVAVNGPSEAVEFSVDGVNFQTSGIFSVPAGSYTVVARTESNCTAELEISIGSSETTVFITAIMSDPATCGESDATIRVIASSEDGILQYKLDDGNFQSSNTFSNLGAGTYNVTVQDGSGCEISREEQILTGTSLNNEILPLLELNCAVANCHNGDNGTSRNWTVAENVINSATRIKERTQAGEMPPPGSGQSLTAAEIELISCWVNDGAKSN